MRILKISKDYYPDKTGIAVTSTEVAEWFAAKGHDVTVVAALPFYPEWRIREDYKHGQKRSELINKVQVIRTFLYVPKRPNVFSRLLHELSFTLDALKKSLFVKRPDVIIVISPPLFAGLIGIVLKVRFRAKLLVNIKDLVPDAATELNMLRNPLMIRGLLQIEKFVYTHADKIASLGKGVLRRIEQKGVARKKLVYLPDTADPMLVVADFRPRIDNAFLERNKIFDEFIILHSGNMGVKQGIDVIIRCAYILKEYHLLFLIVGNGSEKQRMVDLAKSYNLGNVRFLPLQPRDLLADMYHAADINLLTQKKEVVDIVVPSKLISMMAAGSCIIASVAPNSEAASIMFEADCGRVVTPEDPEELSEAILYYFHNPHLISQKRKKSKGYASEHYKQDKIMSKYESVLNDLSIS